MNKKRSLIKINSAQLPKYLLIFFAGFFLGFLINEVHDTPLLLWQQSEIVDSPGTVGQEDLSLKKRFLPSSLPIIYHSGYAVEYDLKRRNPAWVYEHLTAATLAGQAERTNINFKEDPSIPVIFRNTLTDYKGSGFDRGHLAPAANHKASAREMLDTFYLSNISPQCPEFNRGFWSKLERYARDLTKTHPHVYVISGPLYLPRTDEQGKKFVTYQLIGKNVAVPTHFFKVINMESHSGKIKTKAYIVPNENIETHTPLEHFETTLSMVETVSGILFSEE